MVVAVVGVVIIVGEGGGEVVGGGL